MTLEEIVQVIMGLIPRDSVQLQALLADPRVMMIIIALTLLSLARSLGKHGKFVWAFVCLGAGLFMFWAFLAEHRASFDHHRDRVFIGGDLPGKARPHAPSAHACEAACASEPHCAAYSFDTVTRVCVLKAELTRMHSLTGTISGIRRFGTIVRSPAAAPSR